MAEAEKTRETEIDGVEEYEGDEEEEENGALSHNSQLPNTSLAELNMLLVILSLFYFSTDDCMECEDQSEQIIKDNQVAVTKTCISRLGTKRREKHEPKLGRRSFSSRFHTTIRDSR